MHEITLTTEQKIVLNLAAMSVADNPTTLVLSEEELRGVNWAEVVDETIAQTIPLATYDVALPYKRYVPETEWSRWKNVSMGVLQSDFEVVSAQAELVELLNKKGLPYAIIKGTSAAAYYPEPERRALGDVDFLIDPDRQAEVENALVEAGYKKEGVPHISHVIFKKPNAHLEMHFQVAGIPNGELGVKVKEFLRPAVFSTVERSREFCTFYAPNDLYHGLIILLHMQHHNLNDGLGLRHLCDWAAYVARTQNEPFWQERLLPFLKEIGLYKYAAVVTKISATYLKIPCPDWAKAEDEELCAELLSDMFIGGNFGRKDNERARSGALIAQKGEKKRGPIATLAYSLHKSILLRYPIVKKVWILYPFVYAWKVIRNVFLMLIGKRVSIGKMKPQAEKRQRIYDKLQVFETTPEEK